MAQATNPPLRGAGGEVDFHTEDEALQVLLDADIDRVMAGLDRIVEAAPSYKKLFSRWENQQWNSESFDFSEDINQWQGNDTFSDEQRAFMEWSMSSFFLGEERVTTELLPFAIAAPSHEARAFLATQISDEAKHMVFFDRFYREVFQTDAETLSKNVEAQRPKMNDQYRELFDGILGDCADRLRLDPSDMTALVRGVTVYMVVIEGTLALTGARFIIRSLKQNDWLPGFRQGFTAVNRDESRHVGFGVKFLADAIKDDPAHKQTIQDTLTETLPVGTLALAPPFVDDPYDFVTPFGYTSQEIYGYAMKSLSKKLAAMGMEPIGAAA
jgi:ribonucleoside-diphosphate reductase beta chain